MPRDRPRWAADLAAVDTTAAWIPAIVNTDENAVVGFLRRHGLPDPGTPIARAGSISSALTAGTVTEDDLALWRDDVFADFDAIDGIEDFRQKEPLIQRFRAEIGVQFGALPVVLDEVRRRMWRCDLMRQRWVEFLDRHRAETDRELFLFYLPAGQEGNLKKWRDRGVLEADIAKLGFAHIVGETHYEWKPWTCELVSVNPILPHHLELRWVRVRSTGKRCLTFARIDLETGDVELQIQRIKGGGMQALKAERELFVGELTRLIGVRPEQVRLDPAMRALMSGKRVQFEMWRVRIGQTGELTGKRVEMLRPRNEGYYALEFNGQWSAGGFVPLPVRMDARTDAIGLHWQGPVTAVSDLLLFVRKHAEKSGGGSGSGGGQVSTPRIQELRATIEKLIAYLRRVAPDGDVSALASDEATSDLVTDPQEVKEALETVGLEGTGGKIYFICPDTHEPVRRGGRVVELEQLPPTITCENHPTPEVHATEGNARIKVSERHQFTPVHCMWIAFGPYFALMTWVFIEMGARYPSATVQLFIGNALSALAAVAAIFSIYGREAFEAARDLLFWMFKPILSKLGEKPAIPGTHHALEARQWRTRGSRMRLPWGVRAARKGSRLVGRGSRPRNGQV